MKAYEAFTKKKQKIKSFIQMRKEIKKLLSNFISFEIKALIYILVCISSLKVKILYKAFTKTKLPLNVIWNQKAFLILIRFELKGSNLQFGLNFLKSLKTCEAFTKNWIKINFIKIWKETKKLFI